MHNPRLRPAAASTARPALVGSARQERGHPGADAIERAAEDLIAVARDLRCLRSTLHLEDLEERATHITADIRRVFRGGRV